MLALIMVGVQGGGKTTIAEKRIKEIVPFTLVSASADNYFMHCGKYYFDFTKLGAAHNQCMKHFAGGIVGGASLVICDNTNCSVEEIAPYIALARAYDYDVEIIRVDCDPEVAAARNTHGVPREAVLAKYKQFKKRLLPSHIKFDDRVKVTEIFND